MGLKRIRERYPDLPKFEALDVYLGGEPVHTDESETVIPADRSAAIILVPRTLKRAAAGTPPEAALQFFIIE